MSQRELEDQVRGSGTLKERLNKCHEMIGKMCKYGRPPKMTIPVHWDDEDFFISVTLQDAEGELERLQEQSLRYSQYLSPEDWEEVSKYMS